MKFKIFYQEGDKLVSSIVDDNYFKNKELNKNIIKIEKQKTLKEYLTIPFKSYNDVIDTFNELSLILNSNIQLNEAIDILLNSNKNKDIYEVLQTLQNAIKNGLKIEKALKKYENYIGVLPILFLEIGLENGMLKQSIESLVVILKTNQKSQKSFQDALFYPIILFITLFLSVGFIFSFIVPRFEFLFTQLGTDMPFATKSLLYIKELVAQSWIYIVGFCLSLILIFKIYYEKYKFLFDKYLVLKIPIISKLYGQFIFYRLFLALNILLKSNYRFQTALENSKKIVNNEFILFALNNVLNNIQNGISIAEAFHKTNLFEDLTIRLLDIASKTNNYTEATRQIYTLYNSRYNASLGLFSKLVGPIFLLVAFLIILWLVLAIMLPTLSIGTLLK